MVIKSYKKMLLIALLGAPLGVAADASSFTYDVVKDIATGPLGWAAHAGLGYLAYEGYSSYVPDADNVASLKTDALQKAGIAFGLAALYHGSILYNYCSLGVELRKLKRQNTISSNPMIRTQWAGCDSASDLMYEYAEKSVSDRAALKKQLLFDLGLQDTPTPTDGIKKIDSALQKLNDKLTNYTWRTNIVDIFAHKMIDADADQKALLSGNALLENDLDSYAKSIFNDHVSNSWISNSLSIGWHLKDGCYLKRPAIYTATYNMASRCAVKTLEQFARLRAVRNILNQYIPEGQRSDYVPRSSHDSNRRRIVQQTVIN